MKNKKRNILRLIRTVLAALFFTGVTLLFLDVTGTLHTWLGWMAKIQILPAFLALNVATVVVLLILTLIFGRVYCSVICPLGVMQDIISWTRGKIKKKDRFRFRYVKNRPWLRIAFLVLFIVTMAFGVSAIAGILAPYSTYGRIAQNLFAPVYTLGNNLIAWICSRFDSYAFYSREVWIRSISTFAVSAATFVLLAVLAWRNGRTWCNNVCPVGSVLGFISKFSLFAPVIDTSKCRSCGLCSRQCKASCIDIANFKVDTSRCVSCMDCISTCNDGAIRYRFRYGQAAGKIRMREEQKDMRVSAELIPYCPICGRPMTVNLHCDATFVQDDGWYRASQRYKEFLEQHKGLRVLFLELGVGMNTPAIIKFPFWHLANEWENAAYACINLGEAYAPEEIEAKSICINEDIGVALQKLIDRGSVQDIF